MHEASASSERERLLNKHPLEVYSSYLDGRCLSDAEVDGLRAWIVADEKNAVEFVEFATLHAAITDRLKLGRLLEDLASHRWTAGITPALLAEAIREIETNSPRVVVELPPPIAEPASEQPLRWPVFASVAAVAAVLFVGVWGLSRSSDVPLPKGPVAAAPTPEPPKVAARLGTSFDAQWLGAATLATGQSVVEGAQLTLLSGVAQFDMSGGAAVVVEGPSEITLKGPDALYLRRGKAAVRVAEGGKSFVVDTPAMHVIDLGTEFGVEATAAGDEQVMVFDGSVALADAGESLLSAPAASNSNQLLGAGFQVDLGPEESIAGRPFQPEVLVNERHFVRPDEVAVRIEALSGSVSARNLAAHYARQRIRGLLAYQGFDVSSKGEENVLGWGNQAISATMPLQFVQPSGGVDVQNGSAFLLLDTTSEGPFARAELLNDYGRVGRDGTEVWLAWRSRRMQQGSKEQGSAGVSLMFGDRSDFDEPVFFGRGFGVKEALVVQSAWGGAAPPEGERVTADLAMAPQANEARGVVDDQEHSWIARVEFRDGPDRVSTWLDADAANLDAGRPHAILDVASIEFDRIRIAVNRSDAVWRFSEFAVALEPQAFDQLARVVELKVDQERRMDPPLARP